MNDLDDYVAPETALAWLADRTGAGWTLARLVKHCAAPWFWLDVNPAAPDFAGGRSEGHLAKLVFNGDAQRLAIVQTDVLVTMFTDQAGNIVSVSPPFHIPVSELRFARADVESLVVGQVAAEPVASESKEGREDRRLQLCLDAGLTMPTSAVGRMPYGIGNVAKQEGVARQTFTADVRRALARKIERERPKLVFVPKRR